MRPPVVRAIVVIAATFWLAAGPGGLVLRAALACNPVSMHGHHGHAGLGHGAHMPGDGPCFCSQMVGAFDQAVSVAMASVSVSTLQAAGPIVTETHPSLFPLPPSPVVTPETPPPIVA
jgi:hypothetical protein